MHEYPLTQRIIEIACEKAIQAEASEVSRITLVIGDSSSVVADSIKLYFDIIAQDTLCSSAILDIERVLPMLRCEKCRQFFERVPFSFTCPTKDCGGEGLPTEIGREFYVKDIEVVYPDTK